MEFFGNTIPQTNYASKSISFQDTISKQVFSNLEHFIHRGGFRRWSWGPNQGVWGGSPPVGSRGEAGMGSGDGITQKLEYF